LDDAPTGDARYSVIFTGQTKRVNNTSLFSSWFPEPSFLIRLIRFTIAQYKPSWNQREK
jgi:hypothetical protein